MVLFQRLPSAATTELVVCDGVVRPVPGDPLPLPRAILRPGFLGTPDVNTELVRRGEVTRPMEQLGTSDTLYDYILTHYCPELCNVSPCAAIGAATPLMQRL